MKKVCIYYILISTLILIKTGKTSEASSIPIIFRNSEKLLVVQRLNPTPKGTNQELLRIKYNEEGIKSIKKGLRDSTKGSLNRRRDFKDALLNFNKSLDIKLDSYTYFLRGVAYEELESPQSAVADYSRSLDIKPHAGIYAHRASAYFTLRRISDAIADYSVAIAMNNQDIFNGNIDNFGFNPLVSEYHYKRYKQGKISYDEFRNYILSTYRSYYILRAGLYGILASQNKSNSQNFEAINNYRNSIADYSKAIALNKQKIYTYVNRADSYYLIGEYQNALQDYNKVIALDPSCASAYSGRSDVYRKFYDYQSANVDSKKLLQLLKLKGIKAFSCGGDQHSSETLWLIN